VPATPGLIAEHRGSRFSGEVCGVEAGTVTLRDWRGRERVFPLTPGAFLVDDRPATLIRPGQPPVGPMRTASGSVAAAARPAQVARASRIWVEGVHDAELLEKVWGDDLREAAIVVEPLGGIDGLAEAVRAFRPGPHRRLGILVDHLVAGTKEARLAGAVAAGGAASHVLVTGHPYVDVWQGVRPHVVGIAAWPGVPRGRPWKEGVCAALGAGDPAALWRRILGSVRSYADLERPLVGAVEELIDFVCEAGRIPGLA
jgi:hypothetical protein